MFSFRYCTLLISLMVAIADYLFFLKTPAALAFGLPLPGFLLSHWLLISLPNSPTSFSFFFFFLSFLGLPHGCGILVLQPGVEPGPLAVRVWSHNHWTAREVPLSSKLLISEGSRTQYLSSASFFILTLVILPCLLVSDTTMTLKSLCVCSVASVMSDSLLLYGP